MLHEIVESVHAHLEENTRSKTISAREKYIRMIEKECDLFLISFCLSPEEAKDFVRDFVTYMLVHHPEGSDTIPDYFTKMVQNIRATAQALEDPALKFLNTSKADHFQKGFLFYE